MGADNLCEFTTDGNRCHAIYRHLTVSGHRTCGEFHGVQDGRRIDILPEQATPTETCKVDYNAWISTPVEYGEGGRGTEIVIFGCECKQETCTWQLATDADRGTFRLDNFYC